MASVNGEGLPSADALERPGAVYFFGRAILRPLLRLVYGMRATGTEHVPLTGPVLLVSNHLASWDTLVIPVTCRRPVQFLTKSSYFTRPGLTGRIQRWFFHSIGAVPVTRSAGRDAQAALDTGVQVLSEGGIFAVFPEGSRSRDGRLYRGRSGAAWMAQRTGATLIPVGLVDTNRMRPFGRLRGSAPEVRYGEPISLADLTGLPAGVARREATERIMERIAALSGQERAGRTNSGSSDTSTTRP